MVDPNSCCRLGDDCEYTCTEKGITGMYNSPSSPGCGDLLLDLRFKNNSVTVTTDSLSAGDLCVFQIFCGYDDYRPNSYDIVGFKFKALEGSSDGFDTAVVIRSIEDNDMTLSGPLNTDVNPVEKV